MRIFSNIYSQRIGLTLFFQAGSQLNQKRLATSKLAQNLLKKFPNHPFEQSLTKENEKPLLRNYLAMSEAFPYLLAGSQSRLIFDCMDRNVPASNSMQKTAAVANFLTWDESGGNHLLLNQGMPSLYAILNTNKYFHANLLKEDLQVLFSEEVKPDYSLVTQKYLRHLFDDLSSLDSFTRCAAMVAFEMHAGRMISALWDSVSRRFEVDKDSLEYFKIHVGGDDSVEEHHEKLTQRLVADIISKEDYSLFHEKVEKSYAKNVAWCRDISQIRE